MQSILTTSLHIGGHSPSVIVCFHNDHAGTEDHQEGEHMLLPGASDDNAVGGLHCGNVELRLFYAHRRDPPGSSLEEDGAAEAGRKVSASTHTHASGLQILPVGTQTRVSGQVFRIVSSLLFIVPPFWLRQTRPHPAPEARIGWRMNHRLGSGESDVEDQRLTRSRSQV